MQPQPIDLATLAAMAALLGPTISFGLEQTVARWLHGWQMKLAAYAASFGAPLGAWLLALNGTPIPGMEALNNLPRDWHGLTDALIVGVFVAFGASLTNAIFNKHLPEMKAESSPTTNDAQTQITTQSSPKSDVKPTVLSDANVTPGDAVYVKGILYLPDTAGDVIRLTEAQVDVLIAASQSPHAAITRVNDPPAVLFPDGRVDVENIQGSVASFRRLTSADLAILKAGFSKAAS